jgi:hypothetical protein
MSDEKNRDEKKPVEFVAEALSDDELEGISGGGVSEPITSCDTGTVTTCNSGTV